MLAAKDYIHPTYTPKLIFQILKHGISCLWIILFLFISFNEAGSGLYKCHLRPLTSLEKDDEKFHSRQSKTRHDSFTTSYICVDHKMLHMTRSIFANFSLRLFYQPHVLAYEDHMPHGLELQVATWFKCKKNRFEASHQHTYDFDLWKRINPTCLYWITPVPFVYVQLCWNLAALVISSPRGAPLEGGPTWAPRRREKGYSSRCASPRLQHDPQWISTIPRKDWRLLNGRVLQEYLFYSSVFQKKMVKWKLDSLSEPLCHLMAG